ncbi:very long chain fatty acid elongase 5 isoform X2 [Tamandua tetradactyla]|uniref:very long chain fatty acid elongase 5 isoform X2 n=1 Tax=Tamandua tetradactyla TaxID=48850 RepID=UPI00405400F1
MENFDASLSPYFKALLGTRDTRVKGWFLLDNYIPTLICSVIYLLIVWLGPKYMKNKQPFSCRGILVVYNLGLTLLSLYMFCEIEGSLISLKDGYCRTGGRESARNDSWHYQHCAEFSQFSRDKTTASCRVFQAPGIKLGSQAWQLVTGVWEGKYNFFCQGTRSGGEADMKIIRVLWWYYFSKLIEFMDTFFFILRKNNHQITVLHVYHHATMLNIWWFVMNWVPCGHSYFGATLNSFIHVLMYSYYGLSSVPSMRPYLWWKKYITQGQLLQFVLTIIQTTCGVIWPCAFPLGWLYFQIGYMISLIALFTNFYIQTYNKKGASRRKDHLKDHKNGSVAAANGHANSFSSLENNVKPRKQRKD